MYYHLVPPELEHEFISSLEYKDVLRYAHSCRKARAAAQSLLNLRTSTLLQRYFEKDDFQHFWTAVESGEGCVTGSCGFWVSLPKPRWLPNDLNTVVVAETSGPLHDFLRAKGYVGSEEEVRVGRARVVHSSRSVRLWSSSSTYAEKFTRYTSPNGAVVTVSETPHRTVIPHILAARHTLQTLVLTRTMHMAVYPIECLQRVALNAGGGFSNKMRQEIKARVLVMNAHSSPVQVSPPSACGKRCKGILRRLRGGRAVGLFALARAHGTDQMAADAFEGFADPKYAIAWTWNVCNNGYCPFAGFPRDLIAERQAGFAAVNHNPKAALIERKEWTILNGKPVFSTVYEGLLCPTSCASPIKVSVPLDHGLNTYIHEEDLATYIWIDTTTSAYTQSTTHLLPGLLAGAVSGMYDVTHRVPVSATEVLLFFFTTLEEKGLVNENLSPRDGARPLYGDVLVMKEANGQIDSLNRRDISAITEAFKRFWDTQPWLG